MMWPRCIARGALPSCACVCGGSPRADVRPRFLQGAGSKIHPAGAEGVKHTVDWYAKDGVESAHAEWAAHMRELLHLEVSAGARAKPFWYE